MTNERAFAVLLLCASLVISGAVVVGDHLTTVPGLWYGVVLGLLGLSFGIYVYQKHLIRNK